MLFNEKFSKANYLSAASFLNSSMWLSIFAQAAWISIFLAQSSLHCVDKAFNSYAVFCWLFKEINIFIDQILHSNESHQRTVRWKYRLPDDIFFHDLQLQSFHFAPELISAFWKKGEKWLSNSWGKMQNYYCKW